jgi:transcriptional regulator GlxA family with amidase domain
VIAVSTGSLLLATTGVLDGQDAAGHWLAGDLLAELGAEPSSDRFVHGRLVATASGALAGVDAAEALAKEMRFSF